MSWKADKSLVAWYRCESLTGDVLRDEMGSFGGTNSGATIASGGCPHDGISCLNMDSTPPAGGNVNLSAFGFSTSQAVTISCWIKLAADGTDTSTSQPVVNTTYVRIHVRTTDNDVTVRFDNGSARTSVFELGNGDRDWHHIMGTFDGVATTRIYVDGVLRDTDTHAGGLPTTSYSSAIGYMPGAPGESFNGQIDDVKIFTEVKNEADAKYLMHGRGAWDFGFGGNDD